MEKKSKIITKTTTTKKQWTIFENRGGLVLEITGSGPSWIRSFNTAYFSVISKSLASLLALAPLWTLRNCKILWLGAPSTSLCLAEFPE